MNEPATIAGMLVACLIALLAVGAAASHQRVPTNPQPGPSASREPVAYCRSGGAIAVPEAGPNKAVISFVPCIHTKGERNA